MILPQALSDGVVTLAPLDESAAKGPYLAWMHDPEIVGFLESRFDQHDAEELARFIRGRNASETSVLAGIFYEQRHIGNIKLEIFREHQRGELGLMIGDKTLWGRGIARRAIALISDFAFRSLSIVKLSAGCYENNVGSRRAFEAAGYATEAVRRAHYIDDGRRVDAILMARFNPDSDYLQ